MSRQEHCTLLRRHVVEDIAFWLAARAVHGGVPLPPPLSTFIYTAARASCAPSNTAAAAFERRRSGTAATAAAHAKSDRSASQGNSGGGARGGGLTSLCNPVEPPLARDAYRWRAPLSWAAAFVQQDFRHWQTLVGLSRETLDQIRWDGRFQVCRRGGLLPRHALQVHGREGWGLQRRLWSLGLCRGSRSRLLPHPC